MGAHQGCAGETDFAQESMGEVHRKDFCEVRQLEYHGFGVAFDGLQGHTLTLVFS